MSFFENNLNALMVSDPDLAARLRDVSVPRDLTVMPARSGEPTAQWRDILLHSRYQPSMEAARFIDHYDVREARTIVMAGFGFGYHVRELLRRVSVPIVVVEAFAEVLRVAMEHVDLCDVFAHVRFRVGEPAERLFQDREGQSITAGPHAVIPHPPSLQCAPEYYAALARELERKQPLRSPGKLRVLVVSPLYGGSLPTARYAARALRQLGCTVDLLDFSPFNGAFQSMQTLLRGSAHAASAVNQFTQTLSLMAYARAEEFQADLVLGLAQAPLTKECLRKLRSDRVRTAFWFVENYKCFPYWREMAPEYDYFFTIQSEPFLAELRRIGVYQAHYLPTGCDPEVHKLPVLSSDEASRYRADLSFAGFGYYNRKAFFEGLTDFDLKIWGPGWNDARGLSACVQDEGREFDEATMLKIFAGGTINLNLHASTYSAGVEPGGDFVNPRLFELASCGAFQLVDDRAPLREFFTPGDEVAGFSDLPTLREQIRFYMNRPDERRRIARNGQRRAHREHTYLARMRKMLAWIYSESLVEDLARRRDLATAKGLLGQIRPGHDLQPALSARDTTARLTLDDLLSDMLRARRYQSEPELVLRFIKNIIVEGRKR